MKDMKFFLLVSLAIFALAESAEAQRRFPVHWSAAAHYEYLNNGTLSLTYLFGEDEGDFLGSQVTGFVLEPEVGVRSAAMGGGYGMHGRLFHTLPVGLMGKLKYRYVFTAYNDFAQKTHLLVPELEGTFFFASLRVGLLIPLNKTDDTPIKLHLGFGLRL